MEMGAGWDTEERGEEQEAVVRPASEGVGGGGGGLENWGRGEQDQTTCKSKSEVQPSLQKYESLYLLN